MTVVASQKWTLDNHEVCASFGDPIDLPSGFKLATASVGPFIFGSRKTNTPQREAHPNIYHSYMTQNPAEGREGNIEVITGPMWSVKTTLLLKMLQEAPKDIQILAIKHASDNRHTEASQITSHDGSSRR